MMNKRGGDFDYANGGGKRPRGGSGKAEIRVLVPSKMAGSLIGKGGANIQKLRSDFGCSVRLPDCPGPERILNITSEELENCFTCLNCAVPFMYECPGGEDDGGDKELRLLIHQSVVGGVIGKSGSKVKEIRDTSGAQVKVFSNVAPQSTDRCVQVNGSLDSLLSATREIFDVLQNSDIKGVEIPYDPINYDAFFAGEYGGFGGGAAGGREGGRPPPPRGGFGGPRGGAGAPPLRGGRGGMRGGFGPGFPPGPGFDDGYGGGPGFPPMRGGRGGYGPPGGPYGPPAGRGGFAAGGFGEDEWGGGFGANGGRGGGGGGGGGRGHGGGGAGGGGNGELKFSESEEGSDSTQVTIPNELAGAIIGPGGQRIRKIRNDSKANITIAEPDADSNERIITITGDMKAIQTAQYLLQQSVREHSVGYGSF